MKTLPPFKLDKHGAIECAKTGLLSWEEVAGIAQIKATVLDQLTELSWLVIDDLGVKHGAYDSIGTISVGDRILLKEFPHHSFTIWEKIQ